MHKIPHSDVASAVESDLSSAVESVISLREYSKIPDLLAQGASLSEVSQFPNGDKLSELGWAILSGDHGKIRDLVAKGASLDKVFTYAIEDEMPAIKCAIYLKKYKAIPALLDQGSSSEEIFKYADGKKLSAVEWAIKCGRYDAIPTLLAQGALLDKPNQLPNGDKFSEIGHAMMYGNYDEIPDLLDQGFLLNDVCAAANGGKLSAVALAINLGNYDEILRLCELGASLDEVYIRVDGRKLSVVEYIISIGKYDAISKLRNLGLPLKECPTTSNDNKLSPVAYALECGKYDAISKLRNLGFLLDNVYITAKDTKLSATAYAIKLGKYDAIPTLLAQGALLDKRGPFPNNDEFSELGYAIMCGNYDETMEVSPDSFKEVATLSRVNKLSAVAWAIKCGQHHIIQTLVAKGASLEEVCTDEKGNKLSAVGYAISIGKYDLVSKLQKDFGVSLKECCTTPDGKLSAVACALAYSKYDLIPHLLDLGCSLDEVFVYTDDTKLSAVGYVMSVDKYDLVPKLQKDFGASLKKVYILTNGIKLSAVGYAAYIKQYDRIKTLKDLGASLDEVFEIANGDKVSLVAFEIIFDKYDLIPDFVAMGGSLDVSLTLASGEKLSIVPYLLSRNKCGLIPKIQENFKLSLEDVYTMPSKNKLSAVGYALRAGRHDSISELRAAGASLDGAMMLVNGNKLSAVECAIAYNRYDAIPTLLAQGALLDKRGPFPNDDEFSELGYAIMCGNYDETMEVSPDSFKEVATLSRVNKLSAVAWAIKCGQHHIIPTLVAKGASLEEVYTDKNSNKLSAAGYALECGKYDLIPDLLGPRGSLDEVFTYNRSGIKLSAMLYVIYKGKYDAIPKLKDLGASLDEVIRLPNGAEFSVIEWAIKCGRYDAISKLYKFGVSLDKVVAPAAEKGLSKVAWAIKHSIYEAIPNLKDLGESLDEVSVLANGDKLSAVGYAISEGEYDAIPGLLAQGALLDEVATLATGEKLSVVGYAIREGKYDAIPGLLAQGALLDEVATLATGEKLSAVGYAIFLKKRSEISKLHKLGASLDEVATLPTGEKLSAVGYAINDDQYDLISELMKLGASLNKAIKRIDKNKATVFEWKEKLKILPKSVVDQIFKEWKKIYNEAKIAKENAITRRRKLEKELIEKETKAQELLRKEAQQKEKEEHEKILKWLQENKDSDIDSLKPIFDELNLTKEKKLEYFKYAIEHGFTFYIKLIVENAEVRGGITKSDISTSLLGALDRESKLETKLEIIEYIFRKIGILEPETNIERKKEFVKGVINIAVKHNQKNIINFIMTEPNLLKLFGDIMITDLTNLDNLKEKLASGRRLIVQHAIEANLMAGAAERDRKRTIVDKYDREKTILDLIDGKDKFDPTTTLNIKDPELTEQTLLQWAIKGNYLRLVDFIVNKFNKDSLPYQFPSLQLAADSNNIEAMLILLRKGVSTSAENEHGLKILNWTPKDNADPIKLLQLIAYGVNITKDKLKLSLSAGADYEDLTQILKGSRKKVGANVATLEGVLHQIASDIYSKTPPYSNKDKDILLSFLNSLLVNNRGELSAAKEAKYELKHLHPYLFERDETYDETLVPARVRRTFPSAPEATSSPPRAVPTSPSLTATSPASQSPAVRSISLETPSINEVIKRLEESKKARSGNESKTYSAEELSIFADIAKIFNQSVIDGFETSSRNANNLGRIINLISSLGFNKEFLQEKECFAKIRQFTEKKLLEMIVSIKDHATSNDYKKDFIFLLNSSINLGCLDEKSVELDAILAALIENGAFELFVTKALKGEIEIGGDKKVLCNALLDSLLFLEQNFSTIFKEKDSEKEADSKKIRAFLKLLLSGEGPIKPDDIYDYHLEEDTKESTFQRKIFNKIALFLEIRRDKLTSESEAAEFTINGKKFKFVKEYPIASKGVIQFRKVDIAILDDEDRLVYVIECDGPSHKINCAGKLIPTCQTLRRDKAIINALGDERKFLVIDHRTRDEEILPRLTLLKEYLEEYDIEAEFAGEGSTLDSKVILGAKKGAGGIEEFGWEEAEEEDMITIVKREGGLSERLLEKFKTKYREIISSYYEAEIDHEKFRDEELSGQYISNDQRFVSFLCFLSQQNMHFEIDGSEDNYVKIFNQERRLVGLSVIQEFTATRAKQTPSQIANAKESRGERFTKLLKLNPETPIYIPIQFGGHFTLLAIDPREPKTYRYIDSMHDSLNGDFPAELISEKYYNGVPLDSGEKFNPQQELFSHLKKMLDENGFGCSDRGYKKQQFSEGILNELMRRKGIIITESIVLSDIDKEEQLKTIEEDTKKEAHNNECGFLTSAGIALMAKEGINRDFSSDNFNSSLFLTSPSHRNSLRGLFEEIFREVAGRSPAHNPASPFGYSLRGLRDKPIAGAGARAGAGGGGAGAGAGAGSY